MIRSLALVLVLSVIPRGSGDGVGGDRVPDFVLPDTGGERVQLSDIMGERLTLIDFWATWCGPCVKSIPSLQALSTSLADAGVRVVGINVDSPRNVAKVAPYATSLGVTYPVLLDTESRVMASLNIQAMPTLVVINALREIVYFHEGFRPGDEVIIRREVESLLTDDDTRP